MKRRRRLPALVDIVGSTIWRWVPGVGREVVMHPTGHPNGMTLDADGRLLVAGWGARSVWRRELDGSIQTLVDSYRGRRLNSPYDIVVRSDGSIWFTDPSRGLFIPGMGGEAGEDLQRYLDNHPVFRLESDVDGNIYVTGPGGIHVFDPAGARIGRIRLPHHATNFCFGDADWCSLYITTTAADSGAGVRHRAGRYGQPRA